MQLPFTVAQFLDVFASYNSTLWPVAILLWLVTAAFVAAWLRNRGSSRWINGLLAVHWVWSGVVYHLLFFARINPAARLFAALFVVQAIAFAWAASRPGVPLPPPRTWRDAAVVAVVVYSLAYPLLGLLTGLAYPHMPTFGVPCPTTLLTAGFLLAAKPRAPRALLVIPFLWCIVASTAAIVLGIRADLALVAAGLALAANASIPREPIIRTA